MGRGEPNVCDEFLGMYSVEVVSDGERGHHVRDS